MVAGGSGYPMLFLTLAACSSWIDQDPGCGQDVYWWSDDLLSYILEGDGSGEFSFDPADDPRTSIEGEYKPLSGNFDYTTTYDDGFYLRRVTSSGFGTVYHSGDLDLLWTDEVTDMLGDTWSTTWRVQRDGCDMTIAAWDADADIDSALVQVGSYSGGSAWSWEADVSGYTYQGALHENLSRTTTIEADDGSYSEFTNAKPTGITETEEEWDCGGYACSGTFVRQFNGDLDYDYVAEEDGSEVYTVTGTLAYDGSGVLEQEFPGGDSCEYTYEDADTCNYECSDGSDGRC